MPSKKLPKYWITVDPGYNTGIAFWNKDKLLRCTLLQNTLKPTKAEPLIVESLQLMSSKFHTYLNEKALRPEFMIVEGVYLFGDALRSMASARSGDLFKLSYLVGAYVNEFTVNHSDNIEIQEARIWKGQLNDNVIKMRVCQKYGNTIQNKYKSNSQHVFDAVGIGMNHLGIL